MPITVSKLEEKLNKLTELKAYIGQKNKIVLADSISEHEMILGVLRCRIFNVTGLVVLTDRRLIRLYKEKTSGRLNQVSIFLDDIIFTFFDRQSFFEPGKIYGSYRLSYQNNYNDDKNDKGTYSDFVYSSYKKNQLAQMFSSINHLIQQGSSTKEANDEIIAAAYKPPRFMYKGGFTISAINCLDGGRRALCTIEVESHLTRQGQPLADLINQTAGPLSQWAGLDLEQIKGQVDEQRSFYTDEF